MKRKRIICFFIVLLVLFLHVFKPIRIDWIMLRIAEQGVMRDAQNILSIRHADLGKKVEGPIITETEEEKIFTWYSVLEWGDTAKIHASVYKSVAYEYKQFRSRGMSEFADDIGYVLNILCWLGEIYFSFGEVNDVWANYQWDYYWYGENTTAQFTDILPVGLKDKNIDLSRYSLKQDELDANDSIEYLVPPDRLFYFLQKGYFYDIFSVEFYEPIANITEDGITKPTRYAKVFVNDSCEVTIRPRLIKL